MAILDQHFYHKTVTLYSSVFGNCFNDIFIQREGTKKILVPIAYAAQQKYNVLADQDSDPNLVRFMKRSPRMSFRLLGWARDGARSKNKMLQLTNSHSAGEASSIQYNRVPYKFQYALDITARYMDDLLQIFEQIAVVFNPSIQVVVKDNPTLSDESAITITMEDAPFESVFEGIYESGNEITVTFNFTVDGYLYMPSRNANIIKKVTVNYFDLTNPDDLLDTQVFDEDDAMTDEEKAQYGFSI